MIKTVKFVNFKSLSPQTVELGPLNVLIGANASGKSNFVDAFKFLQHCLLDGVSGAVARRLGWRNTLARGRSLREAVHMEFELNAARLAGVALEDLEPYKPVGLYYAFDVACKADEPYVRGENLSATLEKNHEPQKVGFERKGISVRTSGPEEETMSRFFGARTFKAYSRDRLVLELPFPTLLGVSISAAVKNWRFYELDIKAARMPSTWESADVLMGDGKNLARVLESVPKANTSTYQRLSKLMAVLVPGFESWRTERRTDGTVAFNVKERGIQNPFPPSAISDGTIRLLGVLLAVLHQPTEAGLTCIDEPERCVHPQVLKTLVEVMREASSERQILVTTHSAELVRWLEPSEVLLVDKADNQTIIARAQDVKHIEKFLKEFRLDELWLHGYLQGATAL